MDDLMARVLLAKYAPPADEKIGALVSEYGSVAALDRLMCDSKKSISSKLRNANFHLEFEQILTATESVGSKIISPESLNWPNALSDLDFTMPYCLWTKGDETALLEVATACAVVGARAASSYGERIATELGAALGEWDLLSISGGAFGIDAALHRGSLAAGGRTIAVLACGIDLAYPTAHSGLFNQISKTGLIITEAPPGSLPLKQKFLTRNRLIAALSNQVVVVEAALRSGSLSTANWANELGRTVWGVPGLITSATSAGVHAGIRAGNMKLLMEVSDVLTYSVLS